MGVVQFATNAYKSAELPISAQDVVNCYAEKEPPDAKTQIALLGSPGLTAWGSCDGGPIRGMHVMGGVLYVVSGQRLYSVPSTGGLGAVLGGNVLGSGIVSMVDNGTQLCIVNGSQGYIFTTTTGFSVISDPNFHGANTVTFFDDYFVFDWAGTNKFFISNILDGTTYSGLDFASAEVSPDYVICIVNQQENLLIFGGDTIEGWFDAGAANFPFQRIDGATIERGCIAPLATAKEDNSVFFLGDDGIFYRLNGIQPVRVSTHAIEEEWQTYQTLTDAYCFSLTHQGHKWVFITFVSANATWVFDIATNLWHRCRSWDVNNNSLQRWRGNCFAKAYGMNLIGDAFSGQIGILDPTSSQEFGSTMQMSATGATIHNDRRRVFIPNFELDIETGVGLTSGQGSDPQVMLEWSRDGGRTFGALQSWSAMGKIGAYTTRLRWTRNGQAKQWTPRITISDPVRRTIIAAHADLNFGMKTAGPEI